MYQRFSTLHIESGPLDAADQWYGYDPSYEIAGISYDEHRPRSLLRGHASGLPRAQPYFQKYQRYSYVHPADLSRSFVAAFGGYRPRKERGGGTVRTTKYPAKSTESTEETDVGFHAVMNARVWGSVRNRLEHSNTADLHHERYELLRSGATDASVCTAPLQASSAADSVADHGAWRGHSQRPVPWHPCTYLRCERTISSAEGGPCVGGATPQPERATEEHGLVTVETCAVTDPTRESSKTNPPERGH